MEQKNVIFLRLMYLKHAEGIGEEEKRKKGSNAAVENWGDIGPS